MRLVDTPNQEAVELTLGGGIVRTRRSFEVVKTPSGWRNIGDLSPGDDVGHIPYVGVSAWSGARVPGFAIEEAPPGSRRRSRELELRRVGLWPLGDDTHAFRAFVRLLAYLAGDGHLGRDGKTARWYTNDARDADDLQHDVETLGYRAGRHLRAARGNAKPQHTVLVSSVALHALFSSAGCPVGAKVYGWPDRPFSWIFDQPSWVRAEFLSALMSAEGTTPSLASRSSYVAALAIKQTGVTDAAITFIAQLFASLGFMVSIGKSGPQSADGRQSYVAQLLGGEPAFLQYVQAIGFCRAANKRVAAAKMFSAVGQRQYIVARREAAVAEARMLRRTTALRVRDIVRVVSTEHGVPAALIHHSLYGRGRARVPKGWRPDPRADGEMAWVPVLDVRRTSSFTQP